jgi:hypothetical protein
MIVQAKSRHAIKAVAGLVKPVATLSLSQNGKRESTPLSKINIQGCEFALIAETGS